jgi:hypothetical protein
MEWSGWGQGLLAGCCESGNELSGSIKWRKFLECLRPLLHGVISLVRSLVNWLVSQSVSGWVSRSVGRLVSKVDS